MNVPSVDIYVTYRCNLRCPHCFVGDLLDLNSLFDFADLTALIHKLQGWGTKEITFLGGEPTLYPPIIDSIKLVQSLNMRARIVTNGLYSFTHFLQRFDGKELPFVGFSVDGSCPEIYDRIRGRGNFTRLIANVRRSRILGYRSFAIASISQQNADDILGILTLCDDLGFEYINIHYVTNRGFATPQMVLSLKDWQRTYELVADYSHKLDIEIRIERTFTSLSQIRGSCAVMKKSNLMFFPDNRVFMCAMLTDLPDAHSFTWSRQELIPNLSPHSEQELCAKPSSAYCPAMQYVNPALHHKAQQCSQAINCIYEKVRIKRGILLESTSDSQGVSQSPPV